MAVQDTADDLELHRRLAAGDRSAFDELYRRYAAQAYGLAYRVTGTQMLAQDVVHDAFMALWRAPEAFDERRGSFRTFFLSMVHHRGSTRCAGSNACGPGPRRRRTLTLSRTKTLRTPWPRLATSAFDARRSVRP